MGATRKPSFIVPMAALSVGRLPEGGDWLYEAKFDGYRALAVKDGDRVRLLSRRGNDLTSSYQAIQAAVQRLPARDALLDGEIVAFDAAGRPSFQQLQHRTGARATAIRYFAFDLLHLDGLDLRSLPLEERKRKLAALVAKSEVEFSAELQGTARQVLAAVEKVGLEGVVAKRRTSQYEAGKRTGAWQKFKVLRRQEFIIGGYKPENRTFESLVVGYYASDRLRFAGRVRAGFTGMSRAAISEKLKGLAQASCPFADLPTGKTGHWGEGVSEEDMRKLRWVEPRLVAEIAFVEWTADGHLRHSRFAGLRDDKEPKEVVRET